MTTETQIPDCHVDLMEIKHGIADIKAGDHLCQIYDTEAECQEVLTEYISVGLRRNEKIICAMDARLTEIVLDGLRQSGIDARAPIKAGQLSFIQSQNVYIHDGRFDPAVIQALISAETDKAAEEGYPNLRLAGEIPPALRSFPGIEKLAEYESMMNGFFSGSRALAICLYNRRDFDSNLLMDILKTHPWVILGNKICRNFYYLPPQEFSGERTEDETLMRWVRNLRERNKVEEMLRIKTEHLSLAVEGSRIAIWTWNVQTGEGTINELWAKTIGYTLQELQPVTRDTWSRFVHTEDLKRSDEVMKKYFSGEAPYYECDFRIKHKDGHWVWVLSRAKVTQRSQEGNPVLVTGTLLDITAHKKFEEDLRLQSFIMENLSEGVLLTRVSDGKIVHTNPKIEEMFGYLPGELVGKNIAVVNAPGEKTPEETAQMICKLLRKNKSWQGEIENIKKDGTHFWCYASVSTFSHPEYGAVWISVHSDISERKKAEAALRESFRELEQQKKILAQKEIAFQEVIGAVHKGKEEVKENVVLNIREFVMPVLKKLRVRGVSKKYLDLLQKSLETVTASFGRNITGKSLKLTPREVEICDLIKFGVTTKEIASLLNVSCLTVDKHRNHIRKKLGLSKKKDNLISFLQSI